MIVDKYVVIREQHETLVDCMDLAMHKLCAVHLAMIAGEKGLVGEGELISLAAVLDDAYRAFVHVRDVINEGVGGD